MVTGSKSSFPKMIEEGRIRTCKNREVSLAYDTLRVHLLQKGDEF